MNQQTTAAIVLARTNFGEADRIITVLTPGYGKLRLMAKGVRKVKSKLAGGIELFSVSNITFIYGRAEIGTLISARLLRHYGSIVEDLKRVQLGYDLIKLLNRTIEDEAEPEYFGLLEEAFQALDEAEIGTELIHTWFAGQLLRLGGHTPNLRTDVAGSKLSIDNMYDFDFAAMAFARNADGRFGPDDIKFLRLIFSGNQPKILQQVSGHQVLLPNSTLVIQTMRNEFIRI